jgi:hypothetical protein
MRRSVLLAVIAFIALSNAGCFLPIYSSNPTERMSDLLLTSEGYRQMKGEWKRFWLMDQPSALTFDRLYGGIEP